MNILFVCTGNTCRSPMAEVILKTKRPHYHVLSAGIHAQDGAPMNEMAKQTVAKHQLKEAHASQVMTSELMTWADYVFTMTSAHKLVLEMAFPRHTDSIFTLKEFTKEDVDTTVDIPDPYGGTLEMYEQTFQALEEYIDRAIHKMESK